VLEQPKPRCSRVPFTPLNYHGSHRADTAQVLSTIGFFTSPADETTVNVGLATNSLWIWMIPVTFGWVKFGTRSFAGSIKAALKSVPVLRLGGETNMTGRCIGIRDKTQYGTSYQAWTALPVSFGTSGLHRGRHTEDGSSSTATRPGDLKSPGSCCELAPREAVSGL
jgi:hypothetical protein